MVQYYSRYLKLTLPPKQSAFLWGARKTGKSTYLKTTFPDAPYYDLLKSDLFFRYSREPHLFREEVLALDTSSPLIIVDEVQKIPTLLDEIHWLIENTDFQFILCGSSARKLRREGVNLLGGRAWKYYFFPLVYPELPEFDLLKIFNQGTVPSHYQNETYPKAIKAYLEDYLTLEIQAEGLVRSLPAFSRFLEALRFSHGEMINYSNIARECGVDAKTVREYFFILVDTLLGYFVLPYRKKLNRAIVSSTPKFYLFDVGVAQFLQRKKIDELKGSEAGKALEHYILLEILAYKYLNDLDFDITYWRTKSGLEVDFILGNADIAIEVKISNSVPVAELKGLKAFIEEHHPKACYVISTDPNPRKITELESEATILPVELFLKKLWANELIK